MICPLVRLFVMTVSIVQVMNNTSRTLNYNNLVTGYKFDIAPKTQQYENDGWIPSSNFHDDTVPAYDYSEPTSHIELKLDNGPRVDISEDDSRFRIVGPVDGTSERAEDWYGSLESGGQYILRVDEVNDGQAKRAGLSFLKYEDKYKVSAGYIVSQVIQHAGPLVALVLMAIFL